MSPDNARFISCATRLIFSQTITSQLRMSEYCFTSLYALSWQYRDRRRTEAGTMPYSYFEWLQGFIIVHSIIGSTVHSRPLNSLYMHCKCTAIYPARPGFEHGTPGYKLQSKRMSHRDRPATQLSSYIIYYGDLWYSILKIVQMKRFLRFMVWWKIHIREHNLQLIYLDS